MKKYGKILCALLAALLLFAACLPGVTAVQTEEPADPPAGTSRQTPAEAAHLQFGADGSFRILLLPDIQDGKTLSPITKQFIQTTVKAQQPDIIILTGDNIYGSWTKDPAGGEQGLRDVMEMLQEMYDEGYGAPVALTFGNHDDQSNDYAKEDQMKVMSEYACNLSIDEDLWVDGVHYTEALENCGTYDVPIYASDGSDNVKFNLWIFDSGSYATDGNGGYDHVREKQLNWFRTTAEKLGDVNSMTFQHIIMPEIYNSLEKTSYKPFGHTYNYHGTYYQLPATAKDNSILGESPACSEDNGGEYDALKAQGGVIACVSGHDHVNKYIVPNADPDFPMDWINVPTCGIASYGVTDYRGIRVIDLNESDTTTYETAFYTYEDVMGDDSGFMFRYRFISFLTELEYRAINVWMQLINIFGVSNLVA